MSGRCVRIIIIIIIIIIISSFIIPHCVSHVLLKKINNERLH